MFRSCVAQQATISGNGYGIFFLMNVKEVLIWTEIFGLTV